MTWKEMILLAMEGRKWMTLDQINKRMGEVYGYRYSKLYADLVILVKLGYVKRGKNPKYEGKKFTEHVYKHAGKRFNYVLDMGDHMGADGALKAFYGLQCYKRLKYYPEWFREMLRTDVKAMREGRRLGKKKRRPKPRGKGRKS